MSRRFLPRLLGIMFSVPGALFGFANAAPSEEAQRAFDFWTPERIAKAKPFDLVFDERGLTYLRENDGSFSPFRHSEPARGKAGNFSDQPNADRGDLIGLNTILENWTFGGAVQTAVGRLIFRNGVDYFICSGTVMKDGRSGRSTIITAAHCVYDDEDKEFMEDVIFIPNQDGTTGTFGTDFNCNNDPLGCWFVSFGVVDQNFADKKWPANIISDYAYYIVNDVGSHSGSDANKVLDETAETLPVDFLPPYVEDGDPGPHSLDYTYAIGYPGNLDPNLMYCADDIEFSIGEVGMLNPTCGMGRGSSGGPWVQPMDLETGFGSIISVNSYGFLVGPGMGGPNLSDNSAECLFRQSRMAQLDISHKELTQRGYVVEPTGCRIRR